MLTQTTNRFITVVEKLIADGMATSAVDLGKKVPQIYTQKITNMRKGNTNVTTEIIQGLLNTFPFVNANYIYGTSDYIYTEVDAGSNDSPSQEQQPETDVAELMKMLREERERNSKKDEQILRLVSRITGSVG